MSSRPMSFSTSTEQPALGRKALALISGGLDSALAVYLVKRQDIHVTGIHFTSFFSPINPEREDSPVRITARQLGIPVIFKPKGAEFLDIIRNPRYGHGKNLNPCIDCRIYTFVKAKEVMAEIGASFLVTGEVVGQRPMSQRRNAIRLIEKRAGCDGIVLRPLSAKVLSPTLPETSGIVNRQELMDVAGRGRKVQFRMAEEIGLTGYSPPAGGCLLTDRGFSNRLRDLLDDVQDVSPGLLKLLGIGRHLRLRPGLKVVVGRKHEENERLKEFGELGVLFSPLDFPGPVVLAIGKPNPEEEILIGSIIRRYARESARGELIGVCGPDSGARRIKVGEVAEETWIAAHMV